MKGIWKLIWRFVKLLLVLFVGLSIFLGGAVPFCKPAGYLADADTRI